LQSVTHQISEQFNAWVVGGVKHDVLPTISIEVKNGKPATVATMIRTRDSREVFELFSIAYEQAIRFVSAERIVGVKGRTIWQFKQKFVRVLLILPRVGVYE
jgi:hypothetical protein